MYTATVQIQTHLCESLPVDMKWTLSMNWVISVAASDGSDRKAVRYKEKAAVWQHIADEMRGTGPVFRTAPDLRSKKEHWFCKVKAKFFLMMSIHYSEFSIRMLQLGLDWIGFV